MTGAWLSATLRRVLHHDTFDLFVAPAIADLQHTPTIPAYLAVWTSLVGALAQDVAGDLDSLTQDVGLMMGLVLMQTCYYGGILVLLVAHVRVGEMLDRLAHGGGRVFTVTVLGVVMASALPTLLCFWPSRRTLDA